MCGEKGEERVPLTTHMKQLWGRINFDPGRVINENDEDEEASKEQVTPEIPKLELLGEVECNHYTTYKVMASDTDE